METKKTNSKVKKEETNKVTVVNNIDYSEILNKIFYALIAICVILVLLIVTVAVKGGSSSNSNSSEVEEEESTSYDVSMFDTLTTDEAMDEIASGDTKVVYIGRSTCGYCVKFLPNLQQAQSDYGYKTIYINLEEMTSEDQQKLLTIDNDEGYISENFGYTPMVLIFKDGKLSQGWVGYSEYSTFAAFLEDNGFSK
jgi:predicted bacteriocin transport accessory protein